MTRLTSPHGFEPEITKEQHHRYGLALRWLADQMGLRDWWIDLNFEAEKDLDAMATCAIPADRKLATIALCPYWERLKDEEKLQTMMHELLHCHLDPMQTLITDTLREVAAPSANSLFESVVNHNVEMIVDNLSMAWSANVSMKQFKKIVSGKE